MNAKQAAAATKAVVDKHKSLELEKTTRELAAKKAEAKSQFPEEIRKIFAAIKKATNSGDSFTRYTCHYNGFLASMIMDRLTSDGYKVRSFTNGGYTYDGAYIGPTTEWDISISW